MILCVCKTYSDEKRENGKRLCGHSPLPRVLLPASLFAFAFCCSFISFHFPPLPLFSIPYPVLTAQPRKMPPKASTADQPTTTPKQGTFCLKAPVTLNRVFTAQKQIVDPASLKRVREGSLVSLEIVNASPSLMPIANVANACPTGTSPGRVVCSTRYKEEPCRPYILRQASRGCL